jgi:hypothetical protein
MDVNEWTHNKSTARVPVNTSRRPGRKPHWTAQVGHWFADATTEREAAARLAQGIATLAETFNAPRIFTFKGHAAVVTAAFNGYQAESPSWSVQVIRPDGHVGYSMSGGTRVEVEASTRRNLAHLVTDWHDDASVHEGAAYLKDQGAVDYGQHGPEEFYRYAAWQRAARAAMDVGEPDFHAWATEHAHEFVVPRPE